METTDAVDTVIVSSTYSSADIERIQRQWACSQDPSRRKVYVEQPKFIRICISQNRFFHVLPRQRGLGGAFRPRAYACHILFFCITSDTCPFVLHSRVRQKIPFEAIEDLYLAQYIASRRPNKESGGRSGNLLYKQLVELVLNIFLVRC